MGSTQVLYAVGGAVVARALYGVVFCSLGEATVRGLCACVLYQKQWRPKQSASITRCWDPTHVRTHSTICGSVTVLTHMQRIRAAEQERRCSRKEAAACLVSGVIPSRCDAPQARGGHRHVTSTLGVQRAPYSWTTPRRVPAMATPPSQQGASRCGTCRSITSLLH